jgi:hypothetical protein
VADGEGARSRDAIPRRGLSTATDAEWSAGVGLQGEKGNNPRMKDRGDQALSVGQEVAAAEGSRELRRRGVKDG